MNTIHQIKLGAVLSYFSIAVNILAGLLYTPWVINSIGKENYGLYTLAMSIIGLFLFDFGLGSAVTRFISKYLAEGRQDKADQCLGLVYRLYFVIDLVLFVALLIVFFFIPQIYKELSPDEIDRFKVVYAIAACYSVLSFPLIPTNSVLTAHEKFVQMKLCDVIHKFIMVGSMSVCLLLGYGLYALVIVNAFAGVCMFILKLLCIKRYTPQKVKWGYWNKEEFKNVAGYSGWVTVASFAQRCIFNIAPSILGVFSGSAEIAIIGIAITMEGYTYNFANALSGMFLPKVSRIFASNGDILPLMNKVGRLQLIIISVIVWGFICLGDQFINLWVGNQFDTSYLCAVLIIAPSLLQLPQEIGMQAIIANNKVKQQAFVYCGMAVVNIIGALLLTPSFGATGLCFSICIAYLFRTVGIDIILYKEMHINIWQFFYETYLKMMPALVLSLALGFLSSWLIATSGWVGLIVKGLLFVVLFLIIFYVLAMNKYEKDMCKSVINSVVRLKKYRQ